MRNVMLVVLFVLALLSLPSPARACEPYPDYWFAEQVVFEPFTLPEELSIFPGSPDTNVVSIIYLTNPTETPLFVMQPALRASLMPEAADASLEERIRLAHEAAAYTAIGKLPLTLDGPALRGLDPKLEERNQKGYSRPPLDQLTLPEPQYSALLLVYGEQVFWLPFTIEYLEKPTFRTDEGCQELMRGPSANIAAAVQRSLPELLRAYWWLPLILLAGAAFIWRRLRK